MFFKIHCIFILATTPVILGLKFQVDGKMDFGPNWNYEYRIKPLEFDPQYRGRFRTFTTSQNRKAADGKKQGDQLQFIDIIIKNNKSNPRLIQVAEVKNDEGNNNSKNRKEELTENISDASVKHRHKKKHNYSTDRETKDPAIKFTEKSTFKFSDEHTDTPIKVGSEDKLTKTGKNVKHLIRLAGDIDAPKPANLEVIEESPTTFSQEDTIRATMLMPEQKKKSKRHRVKQNKSKISEQNVTKQKSQEAKLLISIIPEIANKNDTNQIVTKRKSQRHHTKLNEVSGSEIVKLNQEVAKQAPIQVVTEEIITRPVTSNVEDVYTLQDIYIKARFVKDDVKIKEFTRHIYEQSIKTIQSIKEKLNNYEMKKEADRLMKSYEEKFGDFVTETQNQKIKTRLGSQKVILNTLETSNRILDRLINYMVGDMDKRGVLRNTGTENVIQNELNKKKDLENKHLCAKMNICPTQDSFTKFSIDVLQAILRARDNQVIEVRDALTEVLKNTDLSDILYPDTQKRFHRAINDIEKYNIDELRPIFFIMKNILTSKNAPIEVVGREDSRVNKTLAFLEMLDSWEKRLPPNEQNILEWNDMRNSFVEWNNGKRRDTVELMHHFTEHIVKALSKDDARETRTLTDKNFNIMLGY